MKKIGLIGGLAWVSTMEYYSELHRSAEKMRENDDRARRESVLELSIESLDLNRALSLIGREGDEDSWSRFDAYHRDALLRLQQSGAECAAIASNTPHTRFDTIVHDVGLPVIDMFEVVADEVARQGFRMALILGTPITMKSARFKKVLGLYGIRTVDVKDEDAISDMFALIGRLQLGPVENAVEAIECVARRLWSAPSNFQICVILACTELPLAFHQNVQVPFFRSGDITYLNPMATHIRAIVECARAPRSFQVRRGTARP